MKQIQTQFPHRPTAPFREQDGVVRIRPGVGRIMLRDGVTYHALATAAMSVQLPASGTVAIVDFNGTSTTYNISVYPSPGQSILDGAVDEVFAIDVAFFGGTFQKSPNSKVWSVS